MNDLNLTEEEKKSINNCVEEEYDDIKINTKNIKKVISNKLKFIII